MEKSKTSSPIGLTREWENKFVALFDEIVGESIDFQFVINNRNDRSIKVGLSSENFKQSFYLPKHQILIVDSFETNGLQFFSNNETEIQPIFSTSRDLLVSQKKEDLKITVSIEIESETTVREVVDNGFVVFPIIHYINNTYADSLEDSYKLFSFGAEEPEEDIRFSFNTDPHLICSSFTIECRFKSK